MAARTLTDRNRRRGSSRPVRVSGGRVRVSGGLALLAAAAMALTGCGSSGGATGAAASTGGGATSTRDTPAGTASATTATITVAVQPIADFAPVWLGISQGYFADAGLNVKIVPGTATSSGQIPLLSSGQADLAATTATAALQAAAQGIDVQIVGGLTVFGTSADTDPSGLIVAGDSGLHSFADLAGKTVAVSGLKSVTQAGIEAAVKKDGGDPNAVKFVQVPMPNIPGAVASGSADAGFVVDPFLGGAVAKGLKVLGKPLSTVAGGYPGTSLVASSAFVSKHADELRTFDSALAKAADYANAHPDDVRAATAKGAKVPVKLLAHSQNPVYDATVDPALLAKEADLLQTYSALDKPVDTGFVVWKG